MFFSTPNGTGVQGRNIEEIKSKALKKAAEGFMVPASSPRLRAEVTWIGPNPGGSGGFIGSVSVELLDDPLQTAVDMAGKVAAYLQKRMLG